MDIIETGAVLAKIQAFDNRNVDEAVLAAWHEILQPHTLQDCVSAVTAYFKVSTSWIMPAHVVERVREIEEARTYAFTKGYHLNPADDEGMLESGEWSAGMLRLGRAVRTGALTPEAYEAYQTGSQPLERFLSRKAVAE
jgi:hypothetical protein